MAVVTGISFKVEQKGIDRIEVVGRLVAGEGSKFTCRIDRTNLEPEQQATYDKGVAVANKFFYNEIVNTTAELEVNRVTSEELTEGKSTQDFETMTQQEQDDLRALLALFVELKH